MKIDPNDILWSSRGKDWGFLIIQHPTTFECDWLNVHKAVFADSKDDEGFYERTQVRIGLIEKKCVGIRFLDPELRCDSAGRVIPHEFIVFGQSSLAFEDNTDWVHLWPIVSAKYAILYPMNLTEVQEWLVSCKKGASRPPSTPVSNEGGHKPYGNFRSLSWFLMFLLMTASLVTGYCIAVFVEHASTKPALVQPNLAAVNVIDFVADVELRNRIKVLRANGGVFPDIDKRATELIASILAKYHDYSERNIAAAFISQYTTAEIVNGANKGMQAEPPKMRFPKDESNPANR